MFKSLIFQGRYRFASKFGRKESEVRVRYAPSPTGDLHIGGLRTALYNYLFAKKNKGKFILRIEDTDKSREVQGTVKSLMEMLQWYGLSWDEGPQLSKDSKQQELKNNEMEEKGDFGPYSQSQRLDLYRKYAQKLIETGDAYHCFCSSERLQKVREQQQKNKQITQYDKHCRSLSHEEIQDKLRQGEPHVIRLKVPEGETKIKDIINGDIVFKHDQVDDQVLIKQDGYPTYHLANVVDDYLMKITHVIRGEEWLTSTPKHVLIYEALNIKPPKFAHLPLIVNPNGQKVSKRNKDSSVEYYKDLKIEKEALLNFISLLGWSPMAHEEILAQKGTLKLQDELLSMDDMQDMFSLERVRNRNSVLDISKLFKFNGHYLHAKYYNLHKNENLFNEFFDLTLNELPELAREIKLYSTPNLVKVFHIMLEKIKSLQDIKQFSFFWEMPKTYNEAQQKKFFKNEFLAQKILKDMHSLFLNFREDFTKDTINKALAKYLYNSQETQFPLKNEDVYHFLRFIVTGNKNGPAIGEVCEILGFENVQKRMLVFMKEEEK